MRFLSPYSESIVLKMFVRYLVGIYVYIWIIIKYYGKLVKKNSVLCPILLNRRFSNGSQFFDIHKYL